MSSQFMSSAFQKLVIYHFSLAERVQNLCASWKRCEQALRNEEKILGEINVTSVVNEANEKIAAEVFTTNTTPMGKPETREALTELQAVYAFLEKLNVVFESLEVKLKHYELNIK